MDTYPVPIRGMESGSASVAVLMVLSLSLSVSVLQPYGWHQAAPHRYKRRLLQSANSTPYSPLNVAHNGKICILFRAKKLAIRYKNHTIVDLTERAFGPSALVDTRGSVCSKDKATYVYSPSSCIFKKIPYPSQFGCCQSDDNTFLITSMTISTCRADPSFFRALNKM